MSSRSTDMVRNIPPATLGIVGICTGVYILFQILLDVELTHYTMNPRMIIHLREYYRLITSTLFHGSIMHIGMNMISTLALSSMLERRYGTVRHTLNTLWAILLTTSTYVFIAYLLHLFGYDDLMFQNAVGFSGVLFHMSVMECNFSASRRSVFGFITVPSYSYPWVLLIVLQFLMPNLSFVGHLAGILTGTLQLYGIFDCVVLMSDSYLQKMENNWTPVRWMTRLPSYVATQPLTETQQSQQQQRDPSALLGATRAGLGMIWKFVKDLFETLHYAIFGRGRDANANIQIGTIAAGWSTASHHDYDFDDEEWVGLPTNMATPGEQQQSSEAPKSGSSAVLV